MKTIRPTEAPPKIVYSPPDKENDEEDNPTQMARKPKSPDKVRSQSPDINAGTWQAPRQNPGVPLAQPVQTEACHWLSQCHSHAIAS